MESTGRTAGRKRSPPMRQRWPSAPRKIGDGSSSQLVEQYFSESLVAPLGPVFRILHLFLSEDQCLCRFLAASVNIFSRSVNARKNSRHGAQKLPSLIAAPQRPHRF